MSAIGDYVHYHYNYQVVDQPQESTPEANAAYLSSVYSKARVRSQYMLSLQFLQKRLKMMYQMNLINLPSNGQGEKEFFDLIYDLEHEILPKAAEDMTRGLEMPNTSIPEIAAAKYSIEKTQAIFDRFKVVAQQLAGGTFSKNPIPVLTARMVANAEGSSPAQQARRAYRDAYLADGTTFKIDNSYKGALADHAKQINNILANLSAIESILQGNSMSNFSGDVRSETLAGLLQGTYAMLNIVIGDISEERLRDAMIPYLADYLKKGGVGKVEVAALGSQKGKSIYNKQTEDISININLEEMLTGKPGTININLPGVTLKRTNISKNATHAKVHIKNSTVLGKMLDNSEMSVSLQEFFQAYATYNMTIHDRKNSRAQLNKSAADGMAQMYDYIHASILPTALAGSLSSGDFATFMVINDKVYNVAEMIQRLGEDDGFGFITSDLAQKQTGIKNRHNEIFDNSPHPGQRWARSAQIQDIIRNQAITMQLNISLARAAMGGKA